MAKIATTSYDANWYIPSAIKALLEAGKQKEVRKEYTRLRDIAQKRLKRLEKAGLTNTAIYQSNYKRFKKLKDIKSNSELASRLSDLARFIKDPRSTKKKLFEIRDKSLKTLHSHGYKFVNKDNYYDFAKFMEEYRNKMLDMEYDSGDAVLPLSILSKAALKNKSFFRKISGCRRWRSMLPTVFSIQIPLFPLRKFQTFRRNTTPESVSPQSGASPLQGQVPPCS